MAAAGVDTTSGPWPLHRSSRALAPATSVVLAIAALLLLGVAARGRPGDGAGQAWWPGWDATGLDRAAVADPGSASGPGVLVLPLQLLAAVTLLVLVVVLVRRLARHIRLRRGVGSRHSVAVTGRTRRAAPAEQAAAALADAAQAAAHDVSAAATLGSPWALSDAVIAAWVRLETAAAAAGSHRRGHDTAAEFARDLTARRPPLASALQTLLELYGLARFSDEQLRPADGQAASAALARLHRELTGGTEHDGSYPPGRAAA